MQDYTGCHYGTHTTQSTTTAYIISIWDIAAMLDLLVKQPDEKVILSALAGKGIIEVANTLRPQMYISAIFSEDSADGDTNQSVNDLDSLVQFILGGNDSLFSYRTLTSPNLVSVTRDDSSNEDSYYYSWAFNWNISKQLKKVLQSTKHLEDSTSLHKEIYLIVLANDIQGSEFTFTHSSSFRGRYQSQDLKLGSFPGPTL